MYPPKNVVFLADLVYDLFVRFARFNGVLIMADSKKFDLTNLEVQWVRKSVELQIASLKRSMTKEIPYSEIYLLRQREIADLQSILVKF